MAKEKVTKKTQTERRADSDARIISAAKKCFAENGYTNCSLNQIASEAGVTKGLLIQRYESKLGIVISAYRQAVESNFDSNYENSLISYCLSEFIERMKEVKKNSPVDFQLYKTVLNSKDFPEEFLKTGRERLSQRSFYKCVASAQKQGLVPEGDVFGIINVFTSNLVNCLDACDKYGMEYPSDSYFMKTILKKDDEQIKREKQRSDILNAISNSFEWIVYIYMKTMRADVMKKPGLGLPTSEDRDILEIISKNIDEGIAKEDREKILVFYDLKTIDERLRNKELLQTECLDADGKRMIHSLIPVKRDNDGKIVEILSGIQVI